LPRKLLILDGTSLVFRAFFAIPDLRTADGTPTGAVYGFLTMLLRLLKEEKPDAVAVAFDRAGPTFRHLRYEAYKAHRPDVADSLLPQFPMVSETVTALGLKAVEQDGYEADDLIGTLSALAEKDGWETRIVTGDRDALQLVSAHTSVILTIKGVTETRVFDPAAVVERYGVRPDQITDLKGLMGDPSDNIPGVPGVGEKTATRLVQEFGGLEAILAAPERVEPERIRRAIVDFQDKALLSKDLATIHRDVPVEVGLADLAVRPSDRAALGALLGRLELRGLARRLGVEGEARESSASARAALPEARIERLHTLEDARRFATRVAAGGRAFLAYSLAGPRPMESALRAFALTAGPADEGHVEVGVWIDEGACCDAARGSPVAALAPVLCGTGVCLTGHDLKQLFVVAGRDGILAGIAAGIFDTMVAAYLLDPSRSTNSLAALVRELRNGELPPLPAPGKGAVAPEAFEGALAAALAAHAAVLPAVAGALAAGIEAKELGSLLRDVEMPLARTLAGMEVAGVGLDRRQLDELGTEFAGRIEVLTREIHAAAGYEFNVNSTRQLAEVLYGKLQLPVLKKTATGAPSTDAEVLEELAPRSPLVAMVLEHRSLAKLKGTYIDGLGALVNPVTGRVHTSFNQAVTATGRLSSSDPNLQNIPIREEVGRRIRKVFVPAKPDHLILAADYSQIELRVLAELSGDPVLRESFAGSEDIHRRTAAEVFGVPMDEVTASMRDRAKAVNFGIIYGISDYGLARNMAVAREDARRYINSYFARYAGVKAYMDATVADARRTGYVRTILNRRRYLPDLHNRNFNIRAFAERTAMNTPIQGSAADIIKVAMVKLAKRLASCESRMILQVHDELIFEVSPEELPRVARMVREEMETAVPFVVPLRVDLKVGINWYDVRLYNEVRA
jgi:DNA polymerase-1